MAQAANPSFSYLTPQSICAIEAVVFLASNPDRLHTQPQIAAALHIEGRYLEPALQALVRDGIVDSRRGPRGGYDLGIIPDHITVADVIGAVSDQPRGAITPTASAVLRAQFCALEALRISDLVSASVSA